MGFDLFGKLNTDLPQMIGHKGGSHRDFRCLPEGIPLHGRHKIDNYLGNLIRRTVWNQAQNQDDDNFNPNEDRIPPQPHSLAGPGCQ